jgi:murein DD-endopeptidase MepM/ murein hydrolase activator NlpD
MRQVLHSLSKFFLLIAISCLFAACAAPTPLPESIQRPTPTPTALPLPTPTPIPTAFPIAIIDNVRATRLTTPVPQAGAPCGVVDMLDFPVGAPEGDDFSARWSFGRYSDRYNGIHAGEDWIFLNGDSMRKPLYAIGHGQVTFAQPYGWGTDQGVVIIRHVFNDGRTILSFYGHVDPPSVVLNVGDCVVRGQQVGAIGKPRGRPHLHFEIRHHLPATPGPGYWPVDPTLAGWEPPSVYIWTSRMTTAPGVSWLRPFTSTDSIGVGVLTDTLLTYASDQLLGLNIADGQLKWTHPLTRLYQTVFDVNGSALYASTTAGVVQSFNSAGQSNWQLDFGNFDRANLLPLPGGGVIVHVNQQLIGLSSTGDRLWQIDQITAPFDWLLQGDRLLFSTVDDRSATYSLDRSGRVIKLAEIGGRLAYSHDRLFIYTSDGVYRLSDTPPLVDLILPLDRDIFNAGRILTLKDGTLLIAHHGLYDRRLIALNADGSLRWDRSILELGISLPYFMTVDQQVYAITLDGDVLHIDPQTGAAWRLFNGGPLLPLSSGKPWGAAVNGRLIFDFRGGVLIGFDPNAVEEID